MSSTEKKIAATLVVVLIGLIAVYFTMGSGTGGSGGIAGPGMAGGPGGGFPEVAAMGPEDAKLKIVALVPIVNPCHAATVATLKEVYEDNPEDIHLTLIDFFGPDSMEWKQKMRVTCATVEINGQRTFDLKGRTVTFQQMEGAMYKPTDLKTVVEDELAKAG